MHTLCQLKHSCSILARGLNKVQVSQLYIHFFFHYKIKLNVGCYLKMLNQMEIILHNKFKSQNIIIFFGGLEMVRKMKSVAISYAGRSRVRIPAGIGDSSLLQNIRHNLGSTQFPIQQVLGFIPGSKSAWARSSPLKPRVKNERIYTTVPPVYFHGVNRGNVIFTFTNFLRNQS